MKHSYSRSVLASVVALALGSQACTIVEKNPDESEDAGSDDADPADDLTADDDTGSDNESTEDDNISDETDDDSADDSSDDTGTETSTDDVTEEPGTDEDGGVATGDGGSDTEGTDTEATETSDSGTEETTDDSDGGTDETATEGTDTEGTETDTSEEPPVVGFPMWNCGNPDTTEATVLSGSIDEDQTWSGVIVVDGDVRVGDVEVTIEAGTQFVMGADSSIEFGWNSNAATVFANGTADEPITFCGEDQEPGYWAYVAVGNNVTSNSELHNVLINSSGGNGASLYLNTHVLVDNVVVNASGGVGVRAADFDEESARLFVTGSSGAAVELTNAAAATHFPLGGNLTGNEEDVVVTDYFDIADEAVYHDLGVPYLQPNSIDVADAEFTIEAGVEILFAADASLDIGWNSSDVTLNIAGTEERPVVFAGENDDPGFWGGVTIERNVRTDSVVEHLQVRHGGGAIRAFSVDSEMTISHLTLEANAAGAWIGAQGLAEGSTDWTITGTEGVPLTITPNSWVGLPETGNFTGNEEDVIEVVEDSFDQTGTVPNLGVPYAIRNSVYTRDGSSMTIEAGTQFVMSADVLFEVGWNGGEATFVAVGTEEAPISFVGTDGDAGYWIGIVINNAVSSDSSLQHVEIRHAGQGDGNAALVLRRSLEVSSCTISDSASFGILKREDDANDYTGNTFENIAEDNVGTL